MAEITGNPYRAPAITGLDRESLADMVRDLAGRGLNDQEITVRVRPIFPTATVHQVRNVREENAIPAGAGRGRPRTKGKETGQ